jgi:hypothetical protein
MRGRWVLLFTVVLGVFSSGCFSLLGACIGAAVPRYEEVARVAPFPTTGATRAEGEVCETESDCGPGARCTWAASGPLRAVCTSLPPPTTDGMGRRVGTQWAIGLGIGFLADITLLVMIVAAVQLSHITFGF